MEFIIKEIHSSHLTAYKDFFQKGLREDEWCFRITPDDDLPTPFPTNDSADSFTLGAYDGDQLAGVVSFAREGADRQKLRHKGLLFRMYVSNMHRGMGIGKLLIREVIKRAAILENMESINLTVVTTNTVAKLVYERLGFVTYGSEKNAIKWKGNYFGEDSMSLSISGEAEHSHGGQ